MLDFAREDEILREAVGADAPHILAAAPALLERFQAAKGRMVDLLEQPFAPPEAVLERDRLASFFGCAWGENGLVARAGAMLTLRDRMARLARDVMGLTGESEDHERAAREALVLSAFARQRLRQPLSRAPDLLLHIEAAARAVRGFADFLAAVRTASGHPRLHVQQALWAGADLLGWAASGPARAPLAAALAFALARAGDGLQTSLGAPALETLARCEIERLRGALWELATSHLAPAGRPAPLAAIERVDRDLEALVAALAAPALGTAGRAQAVAALGGLTAASLAQAASDAAAAALEEALALLSESLAGESGGPS